MINMVLLVCAMGVSPVECAAGDRIRTVHGPDYHELRACNADAPFFERDPGVRRYIEPDAYVRIVCVPKERAEIDQQGRLG